MCRRLLLVFIFWAGTRFRPDKIVFYFVPAFLFISSLHSGNRCCLETSQWGKLLYSVLFEFLDQAKPRPGKTPTRQGNNQARHWPGKALTRQGPEPGKTPPGKGPTRQMQIPDQAKPRPGKFPTRQSPDHAKSWPGKAPRPGKAPDRAKPKQTK